MKEKFLPMILGKRKESKEAGAYGQTFVRVVNKFWIKEIREAALDKTNEAEKLFMEGEGLFQQKKYSEAAVAYETSIQHLPTISAYINSGVACYFSNNHEKAKDLWERGLTLVLKRVSLNIERGNLKGAQEYSQDEKALRTNLFLLPSASKE